ncbi:unnamed protein product [Phyllotreta striolata]|uniref:C2H2-type domain-containing protein n=1 Tax=Phyllotreta striolata TaxID=444603 RepID=A0A9N9XWC5_PHYSR|nr:unnamed protein product [Phyllotreta striolata]
MQWFIEPSKWPSHLVLPMMILKENLKEPPKAGVGYSCSDCGKAYKVKSSLSNHRKWECGKEPRFKCLYCAYKAKQKVHLVRHLRKLHRVLDSEELNHAVVHFKEKCPQCHKLYKNRKSLISHRSRDCGRPKHNICEVCFEAFKRKEHLRGHMIRRHGLLLH